MCNVAYSLLVENRDADQRVEFDSELYAPPGWDAKSLMRRGLKAG